MSIPNPAGMWGRPTYVDRRAGLPDMGASGMGPRPLESTDVDRIMACDDALALAELAAYARSYFAVGGSVILGVTATVALATLGRRGAAVAAMVGTGLSATVVMEARRRARQWEAIAQARLTVLAATHTSV
ncbi:hypothetical protein [Demequina sp. NBRC 110056]|uniref:hypothetical protein n=1 Tax=Demequina sp. NBRC 110056 TaxID=1570345 RepID=UPI001180E76F|nr:hypothetical protein [Demequina sp. NBRC 110056]